MPVIFNIILLIIAELIPNILYFDDSSDWFTKHKHELCYYFILATLLAPLIETLIQFIPIYISEIFMKKVKYSSCIMIVVSGLIFGYIHQDRGLLYVIMLSFTGILWAFICFVFVRRKQHPYLNVAIIHSLYNTLLFTLGFFFK